VLLVVEQHLKAERAGIESAGYVEVGREQHRADRVITEHAEHP